MSKQKIHPRMWDKAQELIAEDARQSRKQMGGAPYSLPLRATDLVEALGEGDAERVAAIMMYRYHIPNL